MWHTAPIQVHEHPTADGYDMRNIAWKASKMRTTATRLDESTARRSAFVMCCRFHVLHVVLAFWHFLTHGDPVGSGEIRQAEIWKYFLHVSICFQNDRFRVRQIIVWSIRHKALCCQIAMRMPGSKGQPSFFLRKSNDYISSPGCVSLGADQLECV